MRRCNSGVSGTNFPSGTVSLRTLRSWRSEFLAYFDTDRVSNGPTEAMNLLIEKIRRVGFGFRNFDNYRLRVLLHWKTPLTPRIRTRHPRLVA